MLQHFDIVGDNLELSVNFGDIPFSHVRVKHLLLLPIPTIIEYLLHHGISYQRLPWNVGTANNVTLQRLRSLPVDTAVPFKEWIRYLVNLEMYLNTLGKLVTEKPVDFVGLTSLLNLTKIDRMMITLSKPTKANLVEIHLKRSLLID